MSRFRNTATDVVVSVDDAKDAAMGSIWEPANAPAKKAEPKKTSAKSTATKK